MMTTPALNRDHIQPQPAHDLDRKAFEDRIEDADIDEKGLRDNVNDNEAAEYVDHTLVIDEAESKKLKRMIDRRYVVIVCEDRAVHLVQG